MNLWAWESHAPPIGWFVVDFALFVGGLVYFAAAPLSRAFAQRQAAIQKAISEAATAHARATSEQHMWRERMARVEGEIKEMQRSGEVEGARERDRLVHEARAYASRLQADSATQAEQELQRAQARLRRALVRSTLTEASLRLQARLTPAKTTDLLDASICAMGDAATQLLPKTVE
ncbi:MAG: hypothetical protein EOO40_03670 [Deltaproteobacteria bacterium]|nr:MAG: hypothetical protein EOO40_03670 [Deltaproteobacteria bacterium]